LYNDDGDNYSYENGNYSAIPLAYREKGRKLTFGAVRGSFPCQESFRITLIEDGRVAGTISTSYDGKKKTVLL